MWFFEGRLASYIECLLLTVGAYLSPPRNLVEAFFKLLLPVLGLLEGVWFVFVPAPGFFSLGIVLIFFCGGMLTLLSLEWARTRIR